jgi:hypothetical protein
MGLFYGGQGVSPSQGALPGTDQMTLPAGGCWTFPSGWFEVKAGPYTALQQMDSVTTTWRTVGGGSLNANVERIHSDGTNWRLANQTGCVVGVNLTTAGSGYTTPPTIVASAGGAVFKAIVGGAVATAVTISAAGSGYTYAPIVVFSAPPSPGIQATGHCTLSAGTVASVVVDNQGAGYTAPPTISFLNDPREGANNTTIGVGAAAVATLTGAGTVTGILVLDHGSPVTAVPTLTFSSGAAAGTAIMCWTITGYNVTTGGSYTAPVTISAFNTAIAGATLTNPMAQSTLVKRRRATINGALSGNAITATGQTIEDGGIYDQVPTTYVVSAGTTTTAAAFAAPTMGGVPDTSWVMAG